jgi:hypothetical protein
MVPQTPKRHQSSVRRLKVVHIRKWRFGDVLTLASVITSKPASHDHFKTGQA